ncbi:hypothetical protein [Actinoplanes sp. NPDC049118]|uniref:hypothetical protein n=1 Tax=Actinoplanes sp. NPDC049118 TaxID=3155769 RepID=UPI0033C0D366
MTAPRKADLPATLTVEFPCERRCQAEFDLEGIQIRFTLGQMLATTGRAHDKAHAGEPVRVFRYQDAILVRAAVADV